MILLMSSRHCEGFGHALDVRCGGRQPWLRTLRLAATAANCGSDESKGELTMGEPSSPCAPRFCRSHVSAGMSS